MINLVGSQFNKMRLCRYSVFHHRKKLVTWTFILVCTLTLVTVIKLFQELSQVTNGNETQRRKIVASNGLRIDEDDVMKHLKSNRKQTEYIDKRGMHVVVGKYVGETLSTPNLTFEETNANNFWVIKTNHVNCSNNICISMKPDWIAMLRSL